MPIKIEGLTVTNSKKSAIHVHGNDIDNTCPVCGRGMGLEIDGLTVKMACLCGHKVEVVRGGDGER